MTRLLKQMLAAGLVLALALAVMPPIGVQAQGTCGTAPAPRLTVGATARVSITPDGTGNNLRAAASSSAATTVLGVMSVGEVFAVLAGPQCVDDFYWYQVRRWDGQVGWTAEGNASGYWVEPWPQAGAQISPGPRPNLTGVEFAYLSGNGTAMLPYAAQLETGVARGLGSSVANDHAIVWSPDGTQAAYSDGNEIWVVGQFDIMNVTNTPAQSEHSPTWSPDGTRLAYVAELAGNAEIYSVNLAGLAAMNLTNNAAVDRAPVWSPDGTRIAFTSDRDGNSEIFVMGAADGSGVQQLTTTNPGTSNLTPAWSPDGFRLAYTLETATDSSLYTMQLGTIPQPLVDTMWAAGPVWSPDGTRIAFTGQAADGTQDVYSVFADGADILRYTVNGAAVMGIDWTPDGNWLVYADQSSGNYEVYAIRSGGFGLVNLSNNPGAHDVYPSVASVAGPGTVGTPASTQQAAVAANPGAQDLLLIYNASVPVFTLQNVSGGEINLTPLSFEGNGLSVPATVWTDYTVAPLDSFMNYGCLMIWSFGIADQPSPPECGSARQGWITDSRYIFWKGAAFSVKYNGALVASCDVATGSCYVDLP